MERLRIPEPLLGKLRDIRATQLQHPYPDEVFEREDCIILTLGLGPAIYLCLDGRVLIWHYMDDEPLRETTDIQDVASGIVIGAEWLELDELHDLLPKQPENGVRCPTCDGTRWMDFGRNRHNTGPGRIVCWTCHGLAWVSQPTS